jgi:multicomponent Na+:H+ antiporter subunit F
MSGWLVGLLYAVLAALSLAVLLTLYRLVRGPSLADRAVSLDLMALQLVGAMAAWSILTRQPVLLDVALILAIISSVGTIAIARYLVTGKGGKS